MDLRGQQDLNLEADLIFFSINSNNIQKIHILFYKLTSNSSNKKFEFLPLQSGPGVLQHLNLKAEFNIFFRYVETNLKDACIVL